MPRERIVPSRISKVTSTWSEKSPTGIRAGNRLSLRQEQALLSARGYRDLFECENQKKRDQPGPWVRIQHLGSTGRIENRWDRNHSIAYVGLVRRFLSGRRIARHNESLVRYRDGSPGHGLEGGFARRISMKVVGMMLLFAGMVVTASATVPEIDASSGASALALLSGGLWLLKTRRKK